MAAGFRCVQGFRLSVARFLAIILLAVLISAIIAPRAQAAVPATCDPDYWNAMRAKAWMEAQREVAQNQNLIYKADSVLEYSCFDSFLRALASNAIHMFSENENIFNVPIAAISDISMDNSLNILVTEAVSRYVTESFDHSFLGGRAGPNYTPTQDVTTGAGYVYTCTMMSAAWEAARCMNFNNQDSVDDFFPLIDYRASWDPRSTLPQYFTCTAPATEWTNNYNLATNNPVVYQEQAVQAQLHFFTGGSGNNACPAPRIPTGIQVQRGQGNARQDYQEYVCVNPGCAYDRESNSCSQTVTP